MSNLVERAGVREQTVTAWVSGDWAALLAQLASRNERSISGELRLALRKHLRDEGLLAA